MTNETTQLSPMHPGEVLREEFMEPNRLTAYALAKACRIPRTRIERIAREESGITTDTALRLAKFFGTTAQFWLNLQNRYEMETTEPEIRAELDAIDGSNLLAA
ncbi:MAG: HigA family addiction module antitoxin [Rhizobiaceae bacterium]|nr:HigA family addiction module antitoxin [Rhizobiaceae bacterium]